MVFHTMTASLADPRNPWVLSQQRSFLPRHHPLLRLPKIHVRPTRPGNTGPDAAVQLYRPTRLKSSRSTASDIRSTSSTESEYWDASEGEDDSESVKPEPMWSSLNDRFRNWLANGGVWTTPEQRPELYPEATDHSLYPTLPEVPKREDHDGQVRPSPTDTRTVSTQSDPPLPPSTVTAETQTAPIGNTVAATQTTPAYETHVGTQTEIPDPIQSPETRTEPIIDALDGDDDDLGPPPSPIQRPAHVFRRHRNLSHRGEPYRDDRPLPPFPVLPPEHPAFTNPPIPLTREDVANMRGSHREIFSRTTPGRRMFLPWFGRSPQTSTAHDHPGDEESERPPKRILLELPTAEGVLVTQDAVLPQEVPTPYRPEPHRIEPGHPEPNLGADLHDAARSLGDRFRSLLPITQGHLRVVQADVPRVVVEHPNFEHMRRGFIRRQSRRKRTDRTRYGTEEFVEDFPTQHTSNKRTRRK